MNTRRLYQTVLLLVCFTGAVRGEIGPAGLQYAEKTVAGEPYLQSQIPARLAEINKACTSRSLNSQYDKELAYIGSLASHAPLSNEIIKELVAMVDIMDSHHLAWRTAFTNREQKADTEQNEPPALGWYSSPAAALLVFSCSEKKELIEKSLANYKGKPQYRILKEVLEQIDFNERRRIRDEEKRKRPKPKKLVRAPQDVPAQEALPVGVVISKSAIYTGCGVMAILIAAWFAWRKRRKI